MRGNSQDSSLKVKMGTNPFSIKFYKAKITVWLCDKNGNSRTLCSMWLFSNSLFWIKPNNPMESFMFDKQLFPSRKVPNGNFYLVYYLQINWDWVCQVLGAHSWQPAPCKTLPHSNKFVESSPLFGSVLIPSGTANWLIQSHWLFN